MRASGTPASARGLDLDQFGGVLGAVAPVARGVARRLGEQATLVIVADGLDGHAGVGGELADGDHALGLPSTSPPPTTWIISPDAAAAVQYGRYLAVEASLSLDAWSLPGWA
jgi:hypothetical protein